MNVQMHMEIINSNNSLTICLVLSTIKSYWACVWNTKVNKKSSIRFHILLLIPLSFFISVSFKKMHMMWANKFLWKSLNCFNLKLNQSIKSEKEIWVWTQKSSNHVFKVLSFNQIFTFCICDTEKNWDQFFGNKLLSFFIWNLIWSFDSFCSR